MSETDENTDNKKTNAFISVEKIKPDLRKKDPPLLDVKLSNPVTYIKSWWKRVMGNEGLDIRIKIKPITAILITVIVASLSFGLAKVVLPFKVPFLDFSSSVSPTPVPYRETAFVGILRHSEEDNRYFLETNIPEVLNLQIPENIDLEDFIGRKVFALGSYNEEERILIVDNVSDLEIFPVSTVLIPTLTPSPTPVPTFTPSPTVVSTDASTNTPTPIATDTLEPTLTSSP